MYSISLGTGEHLSSYDLRDKERMKKVSALGLSSLKYLKEELDKIDIKELEKDRWSNE